MVDNRNPEVSSRMRDIFDNNDSMPSEISTSIQPTVDITPRGKLKAQTTTGTSTTRTDTYTVPSGKYWKLKSVFTSRANSGPNTWTVLLSGTQYSFYETTGTTTQAFPNDLLLRAGESVRGVAGGGTSGLIQSYVLYEEFEEA